ncbi:ATP-binding protein [Sinanaerobacter sp. ZZT-01]|uniref:ATP-binding protein n=1 Tax=Sinanaerobacter sp. ZZT-01 TaxID=3111540 RepID=UPI002D7715E3|nr:AAA family ATPase [Sinanaerobacter sp. ZZT-01]WRR95092.1 AAA family ATPase [Sinanaerobacter sp. ZZT-01]
MLQEELKKGGVLPEQVLSYKFDSLRYEEIDTASKLYKEIEKKIISEARTYLFLDEVQEVKDWEKAINSFMMDFNVDIFVTCSNSRMMSSEISTYLTDEFAGGNYEGIKTMHVADFLLSQEY